jgi:glycosyltransferase involved in cell wall biosynthesis
MDENPRYRWLGERPQWQVRRLMARCRAMVLPSLLEGGANVASEAVVAGLPILATLVPGTRGMLGEAYSGYFGVGATEELAELLDRCERQPEFLARLAAQIRALAPRFEPERETAAWKSLIEELSG